tara:strand:+ start:390 stop:632 length:243 start_codon:yes stop_codon:yes gene_type:complete
LPHGNESGKNLPLSSPVSVGIKEALEKSRFFFDTTPRARRLRLRSNQGAVPRMSVALSVSAVLAAALAQAQEKVSAAREN